MAKYKVLQRWHDLETNQTYDSGEEIDITVKRAEEVIKALPSSRGDFLERAHPPKGESKDD